MNRCFLMIWVVAVSRLKMMIPSGSCPVGLGPADEEVGGARPVVSNAPPPPLPSLFLCSSFKRSLFLHFALRFWNHTCKIQIRFWIRFRVSIQSITISYSKIPSLKNRPNIISWINFSSSRDREQKEDRKEREKLASISISEEDRFCHNEDA